MSVLAPGGARTRRLASLLGGTALVSVAALSMAVTEASAACTTLFTGVVDCLANTTTTNTTNTNGATNPSSDRVQEFNNSANITPTIDRDSRRLWPPALAHQRRVQLHRRHQQRHRHDQSERQCSGA